MNLLEHIVEAVDEQAQLVPAFFAGAHGIIFPFRNCFRRLHQVQNGVGNHRLQVRRKQEGRRGRNQHHDGQDAGVALQAFVHRTQIRFQ